MHSTNEYAIVCVQLLTDHEVGSWNMISTKVLGVTPRIAKALLPDRQKGANCVLARRTESPT